MTRKTIPLLAITVASFAASSSLASAAMTLLNGATESRSAGFVGFLDTTTAGTVAWSFNKSADHTVNSGGVLSSVVVEAVTGTGAASPSTGTAPTLAITNSTNAGGGLGFDINGFNWNYGYAGGDAAQRYEIANDGGGIYSSGGTLTLAIPNSVATTGQMYHVELLAFGLVTPNIVMRAMDVSANGTGYVTNWDVMNNVANHYNGLLEFDVMADANGISILVGPGNEAGATTYDPYISALSLTPLAVPEPSACLLGGLGLLALLRRRR